MTLHNKAKNLILLGTTFAALSTNVNASDCTIYNPNFEKVGVYIQRAMELKGYTVINALEHGEFTDRRYDPITQMVYKTGRTTPPEGTRYTFDYSEEYSMWRRFLKGGIKRKVTLTSPQSGEVLRFKHVEDALFEDLTLARMIAGGLPQCGNP